MDCREFTNNIKDFIKGTISDEKYEDFVKHNDSCDECHEELEILYLVQNTLTEEDYWENSSYNLNENLNNYFKKYTDMVYKRYKSNFLKGITLISAEIVSLASIIYCGLRVLMYLTKG